MLATLNALGWTFMLVSCIGVTSLTVWCFKKVLTRKDGEPDLPPGLGP
jgi:hypothetical protein